MPPQYRKFQAQVTGSVEDLRRTVLPVLDKFIVLSFDIFDTLAERLTDPPDQIKRLAARRLTERLAEYTDRKISVEEILQLRDAIETELRNRSAAAGLDHECRFIDLAGAIAGKLGEGQHGERPTTAQIQGLRDAIVASELVAESQVLRPKLGMTELLAELKVSGKRIIAISDMYLDGPMIHKLLDQLGLGRYIDAIYVSADHSLGKYSGRLFHHVFEAESISPVELLHIGDNAVSDFDVPVSAGTSAVLFRNPNQTRRQQVNQTYKWLSDRNPYWRGRHLVSGIPKTNSNDFFSVFGFEILGPIYATFVAAVREALLADRIDRAFFLARDSELFHRMHAVFDSPTLGLPPAPESTYLHISRKSVALPAAHRGLGLRQLQILLPRMQQGGIAAIAGALGLEPNALKEVAHRYKLDSVSTPVDAGSRDWPTLLAADTGLDEIVRDRARGARELLRLYLQQEGFFGAGRRVALVDIGWSGSIQRALKDAFSDDHDWPNVRGYYLSFNDNLGHGLDEHEAVGLLFDKRRNHPRHSIFEHFEEIFENGARALDATTIGYRRLDDGSVLPVLLSDCASDRRAEHGFDPIAKRLRDGALSYSTLFAERYSLAGYRAADVQPYVLELARRAVFFPSREEADQLLRMIHAEDAGTNHILDFSAYRLSGPRVLWRPFRLLRLLRESHWKYGTGRTLGVPGFNRLLRLVHLALIAHRMPRNGLHALAQMPTPHWWETLLLKTVEHGGIPLLLRLRDKIRRFR
jgi:FMN phosphatase YigB (HAD superfamily)